MATVIVSFTTVKQSVPADSDLSLYLVSIGAAAQKVAFGTLEATFADVAPGDYTATVSLSNADGSHLDFARTAPFNVPVPTMILDAPDVVSVTVS